MHVEQLLTCTDEYIKKKLVIHKIEMMKYHLYLNYNDCS